MDFNINLLAVLVATALYFALGAAWYSKLLFADPWMEGQGVTADDIDRSGMGASMLTTFVLELLAVVVLAVVLASMGIGAWLTGALAGLLLAVGIGFVPMAVSAVFESRKRSLLWINGGYHVAGMTIAGLVLGLW